MKVKMGAEVKDMELGSITNFTELVQAMKDGGGFTAKHVAVAYEILNEMVKKRSTNFLSFTADIVSTGLRGVLRTLIQKKYFDVVITTCGTLDHDIARSISKYYQGSFDVDDSFLHKARIHRLGNIFIPIPNYGPTIESFVNDLMGILLKEKKEYALHEIIWEAGKLLNNKKSILYWAYKNKVPVIVPGIFDGAFGYQLWEHYQRGEKVNINFFKDESLLSDMVYTSKVTGAMIIGGGISKHHTIWWNQFKNGLDYAIYISTATEHDGSLSGARPKEAISWGKIKEKAKYVYVEGDVTVILPIIAKALIEESK
ncbi:MAG: deoxyhypusine synthase [Thermoplasmata archaeon]